MIWPGRTLVALAVVPAVVSLLAATEWGGPAATALLGLDALIGLAALGDLATLLGVRRLTAGRSVGAVASLGEPLAVRLTVSNPGRRALTLRIKDDVPEPFAAEPAEFLARVPARGLAELDYLATPGRRGSYAFRRVYGLVESRLGLWRRSIRMPAESGVRVYPDVRQIARYTLLARRNRLSVLGLRRTRRLGSDNEFERLRDYVPGDEPRHLDWRATARRRRLTMRDYQTSQSQRIMFLIDCGRMMSGDVGGGLSPLDHAFNAMLMLAHVALTRGDQVGLLAYADGLKAYLPPRGGPSRVNRLVHAVHDIFPELVESRHERAFVELERRCRKRSLVILFTNVLDDVNARGVSEHLLRLVGRHLPVAVLLRDRDLFRLADEAPESGLGLYHGAASAAVLNWREQVLAGLRARGALTLDVFPDELTAPLINAYLEIKARHLL
jgi:uncharacterized protein (DUF58 family)